MCKVGCAIISATVFKGGKFSDVGRAGHIDALEGKSGQRGLVNNLCLFTMFREFDQDSFFSLFERIADARDWSNIYTTMPFECVLTGKTEEAYSALSVSESRVHDTAKSAFIAGHSCH